MWILFDDARPGGAAPLPATAEFLGTVFDEILDALGDGVPYFHIGGDECVLDDWAASPRIASYQRSLGLRTPAELHAWFLRTLADRLSQRPAGGVRAVVWDEAFVSGSGGALRAAGVTRVDVAYLSNAYSIVRLEEAATRLAAGNASSVS